MTYKKSFKTYLEETEVGYYSMSLTTDMSKDEVSKSMGKLLPLVYRLLKNDDIRIFVRPIDDDGVIYE